MTTKLCPSDWVGMVQWMEEQLMQKWMLMPCHVHPGFLAFHRVTFKGVHLRMASFNPAMLNDLPRPLDHIAGEIAQVFNKHILK